MLYGASGTRISVPPICTRTICRTLRPLEMLFIDDAVHQNHQRLTAQRSHGSVAREHTALVPKVTSDASPVSRDLH